MINMKGNKHYGLPGRFSYETEIKNVPNDIAEKLTKEFNLNAKHSRYHVDGAQYSLLYKYPAILFDLYGYVIINSKNEIRRYITKKINFADGIHCLPGYKKFPHTPKSIENYQEQIKENILRKEQETKIKNEKLLRLRNIMKKYIDNNE